VAQAYALIFCTRGSTLYEDLHKAHKLYISADQATIQEYKHLLPQHNPKLPFVTFQQTILKDKVAMATEEELSVIQEFIDTRFEEDTNRCERPWQALKIDDSQSELDLERQYVKE
jgi:hypothetical protein